jgi:hypothetical protein
MNNFDTMSKHHIEKIQNLIDKKQKELLDNINKLYKEI